MKAVNSRSRAPALERTALEAPASSDKLARQEPRNKDINPHRVKYNPITGRYRLAADSLGNNAPKASAAQPIN